MKKIAFIITKSEVGGAQKWVKEQTEILPDSFEKFLITNEKGWLSDKGIFENVLLDKNIESKFSLVFLYKLIKFIKDNEVDLIISSSAQAGLYSRLLKFFLDIRIIYVSHGWSAIYNGGRLKSLYIFIEFVLSFITDSILCVSQSDYVKAKDEIKIRENKLKLIKNKIFPLNQNNREKKLIKNENNFNLLTVSRLSHPKRVKLLINSTKNIKCDLYIVGDGPQRKDIEDLISYNNINNVNMFGEIEGFDGFGEFDAFILISDSEGLPLSAIEAMSVNLPLILSDVGGCSELIKGNGILVSNNEFDISNAVEKIIDDYNIYENKSKKLFDQEFNLDLHKKIYIKYYNYLT